MTAEERAELRTAIIAGSTDCGLTIEEAAALIGRSPSWLRRSPVPRTADGLYLKSQVLLYLENRLSHRIVPLHRQSA